MSDPKDHPPAPVVHLFDPASSRERTARGVVRQECSLDPLERSGLRLWSSGEPIERSGLRLGSSGKPIERHGLRSASSGEPIERSGLRLGRSDGTLVARGGRPWTLRSSRAHDTRDPGLPTLGCSDSPLRGCQSTLVVLSSGGTYATRSPWLDWQPRRGESEQPRAGNPG